MKYSRQREAILNYLHTTRSHPSADMIYEHVREEQPNISLGTVYRNLSKLSASGDILKIDTGSGREHYDGFTHAHYHFVCKTCDKVMDIDMPVIEGVNEQAAKSLGISVDNHSMIFYGRCADCSKKD